MTVNISYIKLGGNVIDHYKKSKKNWLNKDVEWSNLKNVLSSSKIQFSPYGFRNGFKTADNWNNDNQDMLVFDIDDSMSIAQAQRVFSKYKYLIGTTKSHQKLKKDVICDRYRLCIPAINIPTNDKIYFRMLGLIVPNNDEQTEIKTGAFLGNDDAIIIYNDGQLLDCHKAALFAEEQLELEHVEKIVIDPDLVSGGNGFSLQRVKEDLTFEAVVSTLDSCGYEVHANKFSVRDERTMSASIHYKTLWIKDFGGEFSGDIFALLMEHQGMTFSESIRFVSNHI